MNSRHGAWAAALAIVVAAWFTLYSPQLFRGEVFVRGDATAFRPFAELSRERWFAHHERTHWNPYIFAGVPASASLLDNRPQWLPDPLLDLWEAPGRSRAWPPLLPALLVHLAGMLAAGALARALWACGPAGFATAAIAYGFATNVALPIAYGHDAQAIAVASLPIPLLAAHAIAAARSVRGAAAGTLALGASLGTMGLAGHPQYVAYAGMLAFASGVERLTRYGQWPRAAWLGVGLVGAALASAAVWMPARLYAAQSVRAAESGGVGSAETAFWSLGARDALAFVWPHAAGFGGATYWGALRFADWPQYLGVTVIALAVLAFVRRRAGDTPGLVFWAAIAVVAVGLGFGVRLGAVWQWLASAVPFWSLFRVALATVAIAHLATALLAARGVESLLDSVGGTRRALAPPLIAAAAIAAGLALVAMFGAAPGSALHSAYVSAATPALDTSLASAAATEALRDLALRAALLAALAAACAFATGRTALAATMLALIALDLAPGATGVLRAATGPQSALATPAPSALAQAALADTTRREELGKLPPRILPLAFSSLYSNDAAAWRVPSLGGFHGAAPRRWNDLRESNALGSYGVWCRLAVRYAGGDASVIADSVLFERLPGGDVARVRGVLGRVHPIERVIALPDDARVLEALQAPDYDPSRIAFATDAAAAGAFSSAAATTWRWAEDTPDRIALDLDAPADAFLVLADAWFPGWSATIDGRATPVWRVDALVRGVRVPQGAKRLEFRYEPEGWRTGRALTLAAWSVFLIAALALAATTLGKRASRA